jgi:hypothetical protein
MLACGALLLTGLALAAEHSQGIGSEQASTHRTPLQNDWHTYVDEDVGFAIDLPPTHAVGATDDGAWYIHGFYDGDPTVPDVTIQLIPGDPGDTLEQILGDVHTPGALIENVQLGGTVPAKRIVARYETH